MENQKNRAGRKPSWGKRIAIFVGGLALLLVLAYLVVTSSAFIKAVVLPQAGAAVNAKITAESVSLSPFSRLQLSGLRVQTTGPEPLLTAQEVRVRYSLMDILKGNIKVDELTVGAPAVNIVQQPDGTSNLDPILNGPKKDKPKSKEPTKLSVRNISLKNGTIRKTTLSKEGGRATVEIQGLDITLDQLGNGQSGKLSITAGLTLEQKTGGTNDLLRGTISGGYTIALTQDLLPQTVTGSTKLTVTTAQGAYAELAGFNASLDADLTPKELKRAALDFAKSDQRLGEIRASGPLDTERKEGNIRVEILSLDRNVLALAMAGKGMDFRQTQINSTNQITISQGGTFFAASGNLSGSKISIAQNESITPETDLNLEYQATVNTTDKSAVLQKLNLSASNNARQFLRTELDRQMNLSWGDTVKGYRDAALKLTLSDFNLAEWRPVIGTNINSGLVNASLTLTAQQDGKKLATEISTKISNLSGQFGSNVLQNIAVNLQASGTVSELKLVDLSRYSFTLADAGTPFLEGDGAARYDIEKKDVSGQISARGELPRLLAFAQLTNVTARTGRLEASGTFSQSGTKTKALGAVAVKNFAGTYDAYHFENYQTSFDYNVELNESRVDINRLGLSFSQGFNAGGTVDLKGRYDLEGKSGQFTFNVVDLNQNAIRPVLAPSLGENQLVSFSLNTSGQAAVDPHGANSVKANAKISNWVVKDPAGTFPQTPLAAELAVDAAMQESKLDLRDFALKLSPTPRARNELRIRGKLDLGQTNPAPSTIALTAESLDLTSYYDMFAGGTNPPAAAAPAAAPPHEPEPLQLPFQQLAADLKIDQLYLRELAISNWTGHVNIRSNVLQVQPFKLALNGGTLGLSAKIDTGVPGYRYDLTFQAGNVPLLPLANSFSSANSNKLDGTFIADARIAGAGTTGPNLRKHLAGQVMLNLTNLNYEIVGPKLRRIMVPISIALRVPELMQTPVNWMSFQANAGNGVVNVAKLGVQSEAFYAEAAGSIALADVLTNSTLNLPLDLSLRRSLAEKTHILPANTPADAKYAPLPRFVTVKGTVGAPETDINKLAIAGILARGAAGFGLGNDKAEQALGVVGNLLTGQRASTNSPSTNAAPAANLLQNIGGLLGRNPETNTAGTNSPGTNAPARRSPLDLLRALPAPEKK